MNKNFYLFAGVNGAGKSTLYNLNTFNKKVKNSIRINTDEIVREFGDWKNQVDQLKAAKIAINLRNECLKLGKSFNEETTLTGKTILKTIDKAKELGYKIHLFYVGVDSPEIAKERIRNRVLKGGHNISDSIVEKRYYESLENLEKIISKCNTVYIYDNTKTYRNIYSFKDENTIFIDKFLPRWAIKSIEINKERIFNKNLKNIENNIEHGSPIPKKKKENGRTKER